MPFFDSHAHLSSKELWPDIEGVMQRAQVAEVAHVLNICTDRETYKRGLELKRLYPHVLNAAATTPHDVESEGEELFPFFAQEARAKQLVAIGETGLEYFHPGLDRELQKKFLIRYLHLALECRLPVIFHCREAFDDLFGITDVEYAAKAPAILHCFTGTQKEAEEVLKRGWYLSFSGIVTYKKSEALRDIARFVPLDRLLIETDSPYLAPQSRRGKQNEPAFLPETAAAIAQAKGIALEDVARASLENGKALFGKE